MGIIPSDYRSERRNDKRSQAGEGFREVVDEREVMKRTVV